MKPPPPFKSLGAALPSVMGKIVLAVPLRELLRLPECEGGPAAKRDIARELRAQADRFEAHLPAVGSSATRLAAALLRELAADADRAALAMERAADYARERAGAFA